MHGVGPSTVLGGRYAVQRRLEQMPHAERWSAHDTTLERDVVVVCFLEGDPYAAATLDAARRAAGIDNHRLVRVLDVGRSDGIAFFVEEAIHDAHTLTQILAQGGVPAEEARRLAGETATALEASRARGLHHLTLTPSCVLRASDGTVKVRGVATAAALAGVEEVESARASRIDAVGTVAIAYAALTSRWPLPTPVHGLEAAPHLVGGVPAPSEIAAGVPGDLDALCRLTLNDDEGPTTPGDFATQIAPWSSTAVEGLGSAEPRDESVDKTIALPVEGLRPAQPRRAARPTDEPRRAPTSGALASPASAELSGPTGAPAAAVGAGAAAAGSGAAAAGSGAAAAGARAAATTDEPATIPMAQPASAATDPATVPMARPSSGAAADAATVRMAGPGSSAPAHDTTAGASGVPADPTVADDTTEAGTGGAGAGAAAAAATAAVGSALGTAGHAAGQVAGAAAHRVGSFARAQADKAAERRALRKAADERAEQRRISLGQALVEGDEPIEPPLPMLPQETAEPPTRDQSKLVLIVMVAFLVLALVIGFAGASRIGKGSNLGLGGPPPANTVTVTASPTTVGPTDDATTQPSSGGDDGDGFPVLSATGFDPEGDNAERNGEAARTFDGNTKTFWSSEGYASANLGGLKKGVGVALDLGQVRKVGAVELVLPDASDVTVYAGPKRTLQGATKIGTSTSKEGTVTLTRAGGPVDAQYVIVWFTQVSKVSDGRFRATLAEVTVR